MGSLKSDTRLVTIRSGTEDEEVIHVKREWIYKLRYEIPSCGGVHTPVYYDIAIFEFGE